MATLIVSTTAAGCAKKPVATVASTPAPAPMGSPATGAGGGQRPPSGQPSSPASVSSARPSQFTPTSALGDIHFDFDRYDLRPTDLKVLDMNAAWRPLCGDRTEPCWARNRRAHFLLKAQ